MNEELLIAKLKDFIIDVVYVNNITINKNTNLTSFKKSSLPVNKIGKDELLGIISGEYTGELKDNTISVSLKELSDSKYIQDRGDEYYYFTEKGFNQHINIYTFESNYNNDLKESKSMKYSKIAVIISIIAVVAVPLLEFVLAKI